MQETARRLVAIERRIDRIGGEHRRQRQVAARDALGQADEIGADACLFRREHRPGAAEPHGDFVGNEMHLIVVAHFPRTRQVNRRIHGHAGRALYQRFEDEGGRGRRVFGQVGLQRGGTAQRKGLGGFPGLGPARVRRGDLRAVAKQRCVGGFEEWNVGHRERTHGFAVIGVLQADKAVLLRPA